MHRPPARLATVEPMAPGLWLERPDDPRTTIPRARAVIDEPTADAVEVLSFDVFYRRSRARSAMTPTSVIGTSMVPARERRYWAKGSSFTRGPRGGRGGT